VTSSTYAIAAAEFVVDCKGTISGSLVLDVCKTCGGDVTDVANCTPEAASNASSGAIIGGIVGGCVVVIIAAFIYFRKRMQSENENKKLSANLTAYAVASSTRDALNASIPSRFVSPINGNFQEMPAIPHPTDINAPKRSLAATTLNVTGVDVGFHLSHGQSESNSPAVRSSIDVENSTAAPVDLAIKFRKALGARRGFAASHASSDRQPASTLSPSSPLNMVPRLRLSDRLAASAASRSALSPSSPVEVLTPQPNAAAAGVSSFGSSQGIENEQRQRRLLDLRQRNADFAAGQESERSYVSSQTYTQEIYSARKY